jgi:hypothetical protein
VPAASHISGVYAAAVPIMAIRAIKVTISNLFIFIPPFYYPDIPG